MIIKKTAHATIGDGTFSHFAPGRSARAARLLFFLHGYFHASAFCKSARNNGYGFQEKH